MISQNIANILSLLGVVATALAGVWVAYINNKNNRLTKENAHLITENKDLSSGVLCDLMSFNDILHKVNNCFNQTSADRFLILSAMNGKHDLRFCTVVYEQHSLNGKTEAKLSLGATGRYIKFEFDKAYQTMLKKIEATGKAENVIVADMEDCDLKRIYMAEKVKAAKIVFLKRLAIDKDNDRVFYCSFATHDEKLFSDEDKMTLRIYTDQIKYHLESLIA